MKKQKSIFRCMYWALPCVLLLAGCEFRDSEDGENTEPVELKVSPVVATTRSAIQEANGMDKVAIYATGTDYTPGNDYAVYTNSGGTWSNSETTKIYLTNAAATIYGYYPTANKYDASLNIPITLLEGTASTTITAVDNATGTSIASATGEVDCMWATPVSNASNAADKNSVTLTMNHALSMVSFRVYGVNYKGAGKLTNIVLRNVAGKTALTKGTSNTMNITNGAITQTAPTAAATYTRSITGYTLGTTSAAANKLSILVLPIKTAIPTDGIEAEFTIDGAVYSVSLTDPTDADGWQAGNNNLYTVKLIGTELSISKVEVTAWAEKVGGDLEIK